VSGSAAERYLRLGLHLGRHVDGMVDTYFGPAELSAAVDAEPLLALPALVAEAEALLDELAEGWLRDQVTGLRTYAGVLAGESRSYADEVAGCYGVRPMWTDEAVFAAAHERLDELLPGDGPLIERYRRWHDSILVPMEKIEPIVAAVIERARAWTGELVDLPPGEVLDLEIVHDKPWLGFNQYLGDLRGQVFVNVDLPKSALELLHLTVHETYPGHQAERALKEHLLVRGAGRLEETLVLVPTPQSVLTEGIAELAVPMLLDSDGGAVLAAVVRDAGIAFDLAHARAVERAAQPCRWAEVNAALMLHEHGAGEAEVHGYLQRWGLLSAELSDHVLRYLHQPDSRNYIIAYPAGYELCRSYVAGDPERFRHLLTEQVRVHDLIEAGRRQP
jgi:hypothetical protein